MQPLLSPQKCLLILIQALVLMPLLAALLAHYHWHRHQHHRALLTAATAAASASTSEEAQRQTIARSKKPVAGLA